ncbi:TPA: TGS domain-containing protein [Candidatus Poribacteria bacterium]|nr:TGS domain-containing protein [Candidatus Poribacteria bacterium]
MPANLPPQYLKVRKEYELAKTVEEKIEALTEMLALIPKHKGTDKLRASLRANLSKLRKEEQKSRKAGRRTDEYHIRRQGAGQVILLGAPNVGKSKILATLTNATPEVADYPFTTQKPIVGMMPFENIYVQLVDTPPVISDSIQPQIVENIRHTDLVLLVISLDSDDALEEIESVRSSLEQAHVKLTLEALEESKIEEYSEDELLLTRVKAMIVGNKSDSENASERLEVLRELYAEEFSVIPISAETGDGLTQLKEQIYKSLDIIRVYTKAPSKPADKMDPIILPKGSTVIDAAEQLHKDFASEMKYARIWGQGKYDGQSVSRDEILSDEDILEFHV